MLKAVLFGLPISLRQRGSSAHNELLEGCVRGEFSGFANTERSEQLRKGVAQA
jgi:hypothetical protein